MNALCANAQSVGPLCYDLQWGAVSLPELFAGWWLDTLQVTQRPKSPVLDSPTVPLVTAAITRRGHQRDNNPFHALEMQEEEECQSQEDQAEQGEPQAQEGREAQGEPEAQTHLLPLSTREVEKEGEIERMRDAIRSVLEEYKAYDKIVSALKVDNEYAGTAFLPATSSMSQQITSYLYSGISSPLTSTSFSLTVKGTHTAYKGRYTLQ